MSIVSKGIEFITNKKYRQINLMNRGFYNGLSDEEYLKKRFELLFGYELDLSDPKTFNEKLQWLKLYDRDPVYTTLVDKHAAKGFISELLGPEYVVPEIGVWERAEDIDFDKLPERFVLKCTHNSGKGVIVCRDKKGLDRKKAVRELRAALDQDFYSTVREWPYKRVPHRIICEEYLHSSVSSNGEEELRDYKFFCFNGRVRVFKIDFDRFIEHRANYYDREGRLLRFGETVCPPNYDAELAIPEDLDEMIAIAEKTAGTHPFVRVDLYNVGGRILFSEFTLYPNSGFGRFEPEEWDGILGSWLELPERKVK